MKIRSYCLGAALLASTLSAPIHAGVIFDFICADSSCNGSPDLNLSIEFDPTVVVSNGSFTGADNGILSMTWSSGVGDGFTLTLNDLVDNGGLDNDRSDLKITFDSTATMIMGFEDISGSIISPGFLGSIGEIQFREGSNFNYYIDDIDDYSPVAVSDSTVVRGIFTRRSVPIPSPILLMTLGLVGLGIARKKKST